MKALLLGALWWGSAQAQDARVFPDGPLTVRLCPATCQAVNGHGYKAGQPAQVLETKDGWARVSAYLPRRQLIRAFGLRGVPRRPALWVELTALRTATAAPTVAPREEKPQAAQRKPRRADVVTRLANLRNPSTPSFRPGTQVVAVVEPKSEPVETTQSGAEPVAEAAIAAPETTAPASEPVAVADTQRDTAQKPVVPEVVETPATAEPVQQVVAKTPVVEEPAQPGSSGTQQPATSQTLTWEQLQARLAAEREKAATQTAGTKTQSAEASAEASRLAQQREAARQAEAKRLADEAAAKEVAEAEARARELAEQERAAEEARQKARAEQDARQQAEAERIAREQAEAERIARNKAEAERVAREKLEAEARAKAEAETRRLAEEQRRAEEAEAARVAAKQAVPKQAGSVGYTPPQAEPEPQTPAADVTETAPAASETGTTQVAAVKLPPVVPAPAAEPDTAEAAPEEPKFKGPEPTYASADPDPMDFGSRPTKLTKALLDKRLSKLPGRKSRMPKEVVIALRHYGLGLLKNGECKGIARGGISANPGMIYVACTDDPTYLRQFPLEEQSW